MWKERYAPLWFKDHIQCLAPKNLADEDAHVSGEKLQSRIINPILNIRPIGLYEVLRKVWTGIISSRIHVVLHQTGLLESLQDGFRFGKGTPQTLHRMVNILEQACAESSPLNMVFWDTRRAFDSVSRNVQKLAWARLGVPLNIVEYLTSLDDGG